jgi:hypothetical protein
MVLGINGNFPSADEHSIRQQILPVRVAAVCVGRGLMSILSHWFRPFGVRKAYVQPCTTSAGSIRATPSR